MKLQVALFFHGNPGVIETVEGLARRLGSNITRIREAVSEQIRLGLLKERLVGNRRIILYDTNAEDKVRGFIDDQLRQRRLREAS